MPEARVWGALAVLLPLAVAANGCKPSDNPDPGGTIKAALGDPGDEVRVLTLPGEIDCSDPDIPVSHVDINVAVVPGSALPGSGIAADKAVLATSCRISNRTDAMGRNIGSLLYFVDPGPPSAPANQPDTFASSLLYTLQTKKNGMEFTPPHGWGALSFRGDVCVGSPCVAAPPDLIACSNSEFGVYRIDLATGEATLLFNAGDAVDAAFPNDPFPRAFFPCDGLAWDSQHDTIWMSPDISQKVYHFELSGSTWSNITQYDITNLQTPGGERCFVPASGGSEQIGNSGIEVVGSHLLLSCDGGPRIFEVEPTFTGTPTLNYVNDFASNEGRAEDLECDPVTFNSPSLPETDRRSVAWSKNAFEGNLHAFDVPYGTCGLCREKQRLNLNKDLTQAERLNLAGLLSDYLTTENIAIHNANFGPWHMPSSLLFPGHRGYIGGFELWLLNVARGNDPRFDDKFVPLPMWDPTYAGDPNDLTNHPGGIPPEFWVVDPDCSGCTASPGISSPFTAAAIDSVFTPNSGGISLVNAIAPFLTPAACSNQLFGDSSQTTLQRIEAFRKASVPTTGGNTAFEGVFHNQVHNGVGAGSGAFASRLSSGVLIFFPWHAYIDELGRNFECSCLRAQSPQGTCQTCTNLFLPFDPAPPLAALGGRGHSMPAHETAPLGFWWWFEDDVMPPVFTRDVSIDHSAYNHEGELHGGAEIVVGLVGQTLKLDGVNDFMDVDDPAIGEVNDGNFTLDAWVHTSDDGLEPVVSKLDPSGRGYALFILDGRLGITVGAGGGHRHTTVLAETDSLDDGNWHHVAAVVNRSVASASALFVDGRRVVGFDVAGLWGSFASHAVLEIGKASSLKEEGHWCRRKHRHPHREFFHGMVDEVDLFRRALSSDEVASIFVAGSAGKYTALGNLPTHAGRPPCFLGLGQLITDSIALTSDAAVLAPIYQRAVAAVARGDIATARELVMQIGETADTIGSDGGMFEDNNFAFHVIHEQSMQCLEVPPLAPARPPSPPGHHRHRRPHFP